MVVEVEEEKGAVGMPVNSCTMARKLEVSVVRTVVGARREALDRFLETREGGSGWSGCTGVVEDEDDGFIKPVMSVVEFGLNGGRRGRVQEGSRLSKGLVVEVVVVVLVLPAVAGGDLGKDSK